jgi:hypothetical protein
MGKNLLKAWDFNGGGKQGRQMPRPRRVLRGRQFRATPRFADNAANFRAQPVAACGIQFGKARHPAFGGEESQALFAGTYRGEEARDLGAHRITQ